MYQQTMQTALLRNLLTFIKTYSIMKKIILFICLILSVTCIAQSAFVPNAGGLYNIVQSNSNMVVGASATTPVVQTSNNSNSQLFVFIPVSGKTDTYYLQNLDGNYLNKSTATNWNMIYEATINGTSSEWVIVGSDPNNIRLMLNFNSGYLGTDGLTSGSLLYCDKANNWDKGLFKLVSASGISISTSTLTGLNYNRGSGPSTEQIVSVAGSLLTSDITLTPTANFQISKTSGSGFVSTPITLTQNAGNVSSTNIYVRLKAGLNGGTYSDSIIASSTNIPSRKVMCSGIVTGPLVITSVGAITGLNYDKGSGPSAEQTFSVAGSLLTSNIVITPTVNLQISKTSGSGFVNTAITLVQSSGNVSSTTIYVRLKAELTNANYSDSIALASTNATTKKVYCTGTVVGPTITPSVTSLSGFSYINGTGPSTSQPLTLTGILLEGNVIVTPSTNYEISTNNSTFVSTPISLTPTSGTLSSTIIYTRLKAGLAVKSYIENISLSTTNGASQTINCSGTVLGPKITISTSSISGLNYLLGSGPSDQQSFTVSGSDLTSNIVITPTNTNFQFSRVSGGSFTTSPITLTRAGGIVNPTTIYVRLIAGFAGGNYAENITITSTNAVNKAITFSGTVDNGTGLTYNVTVPSGTLACYIAGTMNSGVPKAMTKVDATHYNIAIPTATISDTYKYYSGPNVIYVEKNALNGDITSRTYTVGDTVTNWASVYDPTVYYNITVQIGSNGTVKENNISLANGASLQVASGLSKTFLITPNTNYDINAITYNGTNVKSQLVNNQFTTPAVNANATFAITFKVTGSTTDLQDNSEEILRVYPNPVKDKLVIECVGKGQCQITDLMGRLVYTGILDKNNTINTSNLTSGIYLIKLNLGKTVLTKKFLKE